MLACDTPTTWENSKGQQGGETILAHDLYHHQNISKGIRLNESTIFHLG